MAWANYLASLQVIDAIFFDEIAIYCVYGISFFAVERDIVEADDFLRIRRVVHGRQPYGGGGLPVAYELQTHVLPLSFVLQRGRLQGGAFLGD